jgi:hypothetical protein
VAQQIDVASAIERQTDEGSVLEFGFESIKDIQATIRSIDTKMGILLAALALPLTSVAGRLTEMHQGAGALGTASIVLSAVCYFLAIVATIATLSGIGTAHIHVEGTSGMSPFYAGGLYNLSIVDAFYRRKNIRSSMTVDEFAGTIPRTYDALVKELAGEMMTLGYIRDLKVLRQRMAFGFSAAAYLLAALGFILTR